jgi:hypothetical protein
MANPTTARRACDAKLQSCSRLHLIKKQPPNGDRGGSSGHPSVLKELEELLRGAPASWLGKASVAVAVDGQSLAPGETRLLTDPAEITIGEGTTLRVNPGSGESMLELREAVSRIRQALASGLDRLGLKTVAEARPTLEKRVAAAARVAVALLVDTEATTDRHLIDAWARELLSGAEPEGLIPRQKEAQVEARQRIAIVRADRCERTRPR